MPDIDITTGKLRLDIDDISEKLYQLLLQEFRAQFGAGYFTDWEISADRVDDVM